MRKLLLALTFFNAFALAASAQTPQAPPPHGGTSLTLGHPAWASVDVQVTSVGPVGGRSGGGGRSSRHGNRASADYRPHMQQALADAYATVYPRPAPSSPVGRARILRRADRSRLCRRPGLAALAGAYLTLPETRC